MTLLLLLSGTAKAQPACQANFAFNTFPNGAATFTSTSILSSSIAPVTYFWNFGNTMTYSATGFAGMATNTTYTANGTYTVTLFILQANPTCSAQISYTIGITTAGGCALSANYNYSQGSNGLVNFNNLTTGTFPGVGYAWDFGDNTAINNSTSPAHTYSANGAYVATLVATNNATCVSTKTLLINVNTYCNLVANFTSSNGNNGLVNFSSTSTGTTGSSFYFWNYGDGSNVVSGGPTASHTYSNGTYQAVLTVFNNSVTCSDTISNPVTVTNATCNIAASYTASYGAGGLVNFINNSTGTNANTTYTWNFGNGFFSNATNPSVTYPSSGVYMVSLIASNGANCSNVYTFTINVTGIPCVANANFTMAPTSTPQFWIAVPSFPWNISNATWNWGDNSTSSFSLYAAHQYSAAGMYNICLTVTATCGATATACSSYSVYRTSAAASIINVNVNAPELKNLDQTNNVGIKELMKSATLSIYPNPSTGIFNITVSGLDSEKSNITVLNIVGEVLYSSTVDSKGGQLNTDLTLSNAKSGVYFVQINSGSKVVTQKLVIDK